MKMTVEKQIYSKAIYLMGQRLNQVERQRKICLFLFVRLMYELYMKKHVKRMI